MTVKPLRHNGLVVVVELESETFLRSEHKRLNKRRVDSD